jgi:hypothetical protein
VLDIANARAPRQVGYFRVQSDGAADNPSSLVWDTQFHRGLLWVFDMDRGVEVLRLAKPKASAARLPAVIAPDLAPDRYAARPVGERTTSGLVCPLFRDSAAARAAS